MNRSADWLHQAHSDLDLTAVSAAAGHHELACFACHQLPPAVGAALAEALCVLEDRLRILDALYIPTRSPDSLPDGAPSDHFGRLQSDNAQRHARSIVDAIATALA
jgi:HEPN domain-containing protein